MRFFVGLICALALWTGAALAQQAGTGWLGAELKDLTREEADSLGWEAPRGAKVVKPVPGGPAEGAGLQPDDVLVSLDGLEIENVAGFIAALGKVAADTEIRLSIRRAGREKRIKVTLGARPAQFAAAPPRRDSPLLMLDTGGHMALIRDIAFTPDGRQLVSASDDKSIRVWDLETGETVRTIRGESAPGDPGKIYAMALSPDGKWLAAGGWTADNEIRLYDFASGRLTALLKGHENVVIGLAFSPDGRHLISGSGDTTAILWEIGAPSAAGDVTPRLKHRLRGHRDRIYAVGFTPDGKRAVTGSHDHDLRLWRVADGGEIAPMTGHGDKVQSLAIAPDGTIVSGDLNGEIRLWDPGSVSGTGSATRVAAKLLARQATVVGSFSVSPDGKRLLSGVAANRGLFPVHVYDLASGDKIVTYRGHDNIVIATAISPDGRWAATGGGDNREIHIWDLATGEHRTGRDGQPLTLGGKGRSVFVAGFSEDGQRIGWGNTDRGTVNARTEPFEHALTLPSENALPRPFPLSTVVPDGRQAEPGATLVSPSEGSDAQVRPRLDGQGGEKDGRGGEEDSGGLNWTRARAKWQNWSLAHRKGGNYGFDAILDIRHGDETVASIERGSTDGYAHRAYSFSPDGETVISGGDNGRLTAYDRAGNKLGEFTGHEGDVWALAPSPDGRFLVSGSDDQTVRLWNLKTYELLVTLFHGADGEWVMWTPQGYFTGSPRGAERVGWQINRGADRAADYAAAAQLREAFKRPDIIARTIEFASAEAAVSEAPGTDVTIEDALARGMPKLQMLSHQSGDRVSGGAVRLAFDLSPTDDPVKLIRISVNGTQLEDLVPKSGSGLAPGRIETSVALARGDNDITLVAVNTEGYESEPLKLRLTHAGEGWLDKRGTLYLISVGVDAYPSIPGNFCRDLDGKPKGTCDLDFAGKDAAAFHQAMLKGLGPAHTRIVERLLVNAPGKPAPTADAIRDALGLLRGAKPNDTVAVFLSGHGVNEGRNFLMLPTDAEWSKPERGFRRAKAVLWSEIQTAIQNAQGRRMLFMDTCHSGNSHAGALEDAAYYANIVSYYSARWDQLAVEAPKYGHGAFTKAVLDGVSGLANADGDPQITTVELRDYLDRRVPELAAEYGEEQNPQFFEARDAKVYPLTRLE